MSREHVGIVRGIDGRRKRLEDRLAGGRSSNGILDWPETDLDVARAINNDRTISRLFRVRGGCLGSVALPHRTLGAGCDFLSETTTRLDGRWDADGFPFLHHGDRCDPSHRQHRTERRCGRRAQ
jgi:hypothetical protein